MNENLTKETKEKVLQLNRQGKSIKEIAMLAHVPIFWIEIIIKEAFKREIVLQLYTQGNSMKKIAALVHVPLFMVENIITEAYEHQST